MVSLRRRQNLQLGMRQINLLTKMLGSIVISNSQDGQQLQLAVNLEIPETQALEILVYEWSAYLL